MGEKLCMNFFFQRKSLSEGQTTNEERQREGFQEGKVPFFPERAEGSVDHLNDEQFN